MKHDKLSEEIIVFILTRNLYELSELTRYKIANKFDVNESYLSKRFKKDTNVSLFDYIERAQVHRAAELLKERGDLSVSDVQKMVGIEKSQHFAKKFKKNTGHQPLTIPGPVSAQKEFQFLNQTTKARRHKEKQNTFKKNLFLVPWCLCGLINSGFTERSAGNNSFFLFE